MIVKKYHELKARILNELFDLDISNDLMKVKMYDGIWTPLKEVHFAHLPNKTTQVPQKMKKWKKKQLTEKVQGDRYCISDLMCAAIRGTINEEIVWVEAQKTFPVHNRIHPSLDNNKTKKEITNRLLTQPGKNGKTWTKNRINKTFEILEKNFDLK